MVAQPGTLQARCDDGATVHDTFGGRGVCHTALKFTAGEGEKRVIQREHSGITKQIGVNLKF